MWFQYGVGYEKQEQGSLATSLHNHLFDYGRFVSQTVAAIKNTSQANLRTVGLFTLVLLGLVMLAVFGRRATLLCWRKGLRLAPREPGARFSRVVFYARVTNRRSHSARLCVHHPPP